MGAVRPRRGGSSKGAAESRIGCGPVQRLSPDGLRAGRVAPRSPTEHRVGRPFTSLAVTEAPAAAAAGVPKLSFPRTFLPFCSKITILHPRQNPCKTRASIEESS